MKLEPRLPELSLPAVRPAPRRPVDGLLARLAQTGYRVDAQKWEQFKDAHLVTTPLPTERGERETIRRLRRILDVERRLAPSGNMDALCFHLAAAGIDAVPPASVTRHILASISDLFVLGDQLAASIAFRNSPLGPDGEFRIGRAMAKHALRAYRLRDRSEHDLMEALLGAAFVGYVRSTHANPRPGQILHTSSRLVTLDVVHDKAPASKPSQPLPAPPRHSASCSRSWRS